jgi:hypothetical protein
MSDQWTPSLRVFDREGECRLVLGDLTDGRGNTLQEAAADLIDRLLVMAHCYRSSGFTVAPELGPPNRRCFDYVWELGERAARGEDIRARVFGAGP